MIIHIMSYYEYQEKSTSPILIIGIIVLLGCCCLSSLSSSAFIFLQMQNMDIKIPTSIFGSTPTPTLTPTPTPTTTPIPTPTPTPTLISTPDIDFIKPSTRPYNFYQGKDSTEGDISQVEDLKDNIDALKLLCDDTPNCIGFNTKAWLKHTIKPQEEWKVWTTDPKKGIYVLKDIDITTTGVATGTPVGEIGSTLV